MAAKSKAVLLLFALLLPGCYSHSLVRPEAAPVGATVRARISAAEAERLGEVLGREDRVLRGRVIGEVGDSLLLEVPALGPSAGARLNQRLTLPNPEILELEVRTLDRVRTGAVVGTAIVLGGAFFIRQLSAQGSDDDLSPPKPGGTDQAVVLLRWPW